MAVKNKKKTKRKNKNKAELNPKVLIVAIAVVLVSAIIISSVIIANTKRTPQTVYDFNKDVAQGIDVSEHNGKMDWSMVSDNYDFAFIRVGYRGYGNGEIYEDKTAKANMKAAQKAGVPFGVYFYTQAVNEEEAQEEADFVFSIIKHYDLSLPVIIDFEYPSDNEGIHTGRLSESKLTQDDNTDIVNAFCTRMKDKGYISGIYASSSVFYYDFNLKDIDKDSVIWVADYNENVTFDIDYSIWQYSKTGQSDATESKYVDLNYWYSK